MFRQNFDQADSQSNSSDGYCDDGQEAETDRISVGGAECNMKQQRRGTQQPEGQAPGYDLLSGKASQQRFFNSTHVSQ